MIRSIAVLAVLTGSLLLPSCVLPWPNRRIEREGASGKVVDVANDKPIANALVKVSYGEGKVVNDEERRTSSRGRYKVAPQGPWAWGYFIGPISGPVFGLTPELGMVARSEVTGLEVSAAGYRSFRWSRKDSKLPEPPDRIHLHASPAAH